MWGNDDDDRARYPYHPENVAAQLREWREQKEQEANRMRAYIENDAGGHYSPRSFGGGNHFGRLILFALITWCVVALLENGLQTATPFVRTYLAHNPFWSWALAGTLDWLLGTTRLVQALVALVLFVACGLIGRPVPRFRFWLYAVILIMSVVLVLVVLVQLGVITRA